MGGTSKDGLGRRRVAAAIGLAGMGLGALGRSPAAKSQGTATGAAPGGPATAGGAAPAPAWPDRPVRLIVPFPPGGPVDTGARLLAQGLAGPLGQGVVVENRSGAGGVIGVDAVAKATPDGLTLGYASTGAVAVNVSLLPSLPYDPPRDLIPLAIVTTTPSALVVRAADGPATLPALLAEARAKPGRIAFASTGPGGTPHLAAALLMLRTGVELNHVAYRGAAPAITALLAGEVTMAFLDVPVLLPFLRDGRMRALAVTAGERSAALPEVPTTEEAGAPGVIVEGWNAVLAPGGTPPARIARLSEAVAATLAPGGETRGRFEAIGQRVLALRAAEAPGFVRAEIARWAEVIRTAGIKPD
jgi:tripartite-type tricarboxylate transporter receptor subunit TctC